MIKIFDNSDTSNDTRFVPSKINTHLKWNRSLRKNTIIMRMFSSIVGWYVYILFLSRRQRWRRQEGK